MLKKYLIVLSVLVFILAVTGITLATQFINTTSKKVGTSESVSNKVKRLITIANPVTRLTTQDGYTVGIFAENLTSPRLLAIDSKGILYVPERKTGTILAMEDTNLDGVSDTKKVIATGLFEPNNIDIFKDELYVGVNNGAVKIYKDGTVTPIVSDLPTDGRHTSKTTIIGPDQKLYISVGSSGNDTPESDPRRSSILRYNLDGSIPSDNPYSLDTNVLRRPIWAEGLRNSVGIFFNSQGKLWANHNGTDMLGDETPPEEIVIEIEKGKHYGYPYCYSPGIGALSKSTLEIRDNKVNISSAPFKTCDQVVPALFTDLAHQAPIQSIEINSLSFPNSWRDDILVAYKGSWNSSVPRDCKVVRIIVENGIPIKSEDFLTGFRDSPAQTCAKAYGRPTGLALGIHGEIYVSDDTGGRIFVIASSGK